VDAVRRSVMGAVLFVRRDVWDQSVAFAAIYAVQSMTSAALYAEVLVLSAAVSVALAVWTLPVETLAVFVIVEISVEMYVEVSPDSAGIFVETLAESAEVSLVFVVALPISAGICAGILVEFVGESLIFVGVLAEFAVIYVEVFVARCRTTFETKRDG